jgi:hypothetical protein
LGVDVFHDHLLLDFSISPTNDTTSLIDSLLDFPFIHLSLSNASVGSSVEALISQRRLSTTRHFVKESPTTKPPLNLA